MMVLITIFTEDSLQLAEVYYKHSNRKGIQNKDLERALKVRTIHGSQFWSLPNVQQNIEEVNEYWKEEEENDEENETDEWEDLETIKEEPEVYRNSTCTCIICSTMNQVNDLWPTWKPSNPSELVLKAAIDQKF